MFWGRRGVFWIPREINEKRHVMHLARLKSARSPRVTKTFWKLPDRKSYKTKQNKKGRRRRSRKRRRRRNLIHSSHLQHYRPKDSGITLTDYWKKDFTRILYTNKLSLTPQGERTESKKCKDSESISPKYPIWEKYKRTLSKQKMHQNREFI